jgi:serine/threonine protein phosphatase PrpC
VESAAGESDTESQAREARVREFRQGARAYRVEPYVPEPAVFPHGVRILAASATDAGQVRAADGNEDSVGLFVFNAVHGSVALPLALCVVADGLGGHVSGQDASRLVVRALTDHVLRSAALPLVGMVAPATPPDDVLREVLLEGAQAANAAVYAANQASGGDSGSTIVAALICGETAYIANAGDSRGYVLDGGELRRITTDHSLVEQLVAGGLITPEERYTHPKRNQIFRSLGDEPTAAVDVFTQKLRPGMRLLLCSDGLWEMVRDDELAAILRETPNPREACDVLVGRANEHGGEDNISALVIEITD